MENGETVRVWARVRIDTLIWLAFALVLFAVSAWLTHVITKVVRTPPQLGIAVTFVGAGKPVRLPTVTLTVDGKGLALLITGVAQSISTIRLGTFPTSAEAAVSCTTVNRRITASWEPATYDEAAMTASVNMQRKPRTYAVQLGDLRMQLPPTAGPKVSSALANAIYQQMSAAEKAANDLFVAEHLPETYEEDPLSCSLPIDVARDTFTSRSFDVGVNEGLAVVEEPAHVKQSDVETVFPRQVSFHDDDAQEIHVTNRETGMTLLASTIVGPFADEKELYIRRVVTLHFEWESMVATSHRDIFITVIGTLIALGAAALIEACRPYIEQFVRVEPKA